MTMAASRSGAPARRGCARVSSRRNPSGFVPPYVGFRGWIGVRLDLGPDWDAVERVIRDAYLTVAPKKLAATFLRN